MQSLGTRPETRRSNAAIAWCKQSCFTQLQPRLFTFCSGVASVIQPSPPLVTQLVLLLRFNNTEKQCYRSLKAFQEGKDKENKTGIKCFLCNHFFRELGRQHFVRAVTTHA